MTELTVAIVAAAVAAASNDYQMYQAKQVEKKQNRALKKQEQVQGIAANKAASDARKAETEQNRARNQQPSLGDLTASAQADALRGPWSTSLTGPSGVDPAALTLGRKTLLGR